MSTIKIWIPVNEISLLQENKKPTVFYLENPNKEGFAEMMVPLSLLESWKKTKQVLCD